MLRSLLPALICVALSGQAVPTNVRMQKLMKSFTLRTGQQVMGLGSWISGVNYKDVLTGGGSDHDLRLVIQQSGITPAQAQREWQTARRTLVEMVNQEFGKDAPKVLQSINLYPPNQLMKGVEDAADAFERYRKLGTVPNLSYSGAVNAATPKHLTEGLYGQGAQVWTQMYEQKAGRLYYAMDGKAYAGMADLTHLCEGRGVYTIQGMANTSGQWVDHAREVLAEGRGDKVAKYLERLERDLAKAKDLARIGAQDGGWRQEIRELTRTLKSNPKALSEVSGRVEAMLTRCHFESVALKRFSKAGPLGQMVCQTLVEAYALPGRSSQALKDALAKLPAEKILNGALAISMAYSTSAIAGEKGLTEALKETAPWMVSLPPGVLMLMTNAILDRAKEGGFELAASYQDPWDLLAGQFSAKGREGLDEVRAYTIDDLAKHLFTEEEVSNVVRARCHQAADRGFKGTISAFTDASVEESLYRRCYPKILLAWKAKRESYLMEYLDLAEVLKSQVYLMALNPTTAELPKGGTVSTQAELIPAKNSQLGPSLDRMKQLLVWLKGGRAYALVSYKWNGGTEGGRESQRQYSFNTGGPQPVQCTVEVHVSESSLRSGDPLDQKIQVFAAADFEVTGAPPPLPPSGVHGCPRLQLVVSGSPKVTFTPVPVNGPPSIVMASLLALESTEYGDLVWSGDTFSLKGSTKTSTTTYTFEATGAVDRSGRKLLHATVTHGYRTEEQDPWHPGSPAASLKVSYTVTDLPLTSTPYPGMKTWAFYVAEGQGHVSKIVFSKRDCYHVDENYDFAGFAEGKPAFISLTFLLKGAM